jgi:2-dehydro-3-deoxyglucarate aldolase
MTGTTPYSAFPNTFRHDVMARKPLIGCWSQLGSPITAEALGLAGFDWILLDSDHAPNDPLTLVPQLMALKDSPSAPVVRPHWNDGGSSISASTTSSFPSCSRPTKRAAR